MRVLTSAFSLFFQSIATADMDHVQLEAFLTAQTRRQGGGVSAEQAAVLSRFWKAQRMRVRESLLAQSRWEPSLRGLTWRVDLPTAASQGDKTVHSGPVALVELELGQATQVTLAFFLFQTKGKLQEILAGMSRIPADS